MTASKDSKPRAAADRPLPQAPAQQGGRGADDPRLVAGDPSEPRGAGTRANDDDDDGGKWRHEPVAPVDEKNPLKSIGRAVADTITGGAESQAKIETEAGAKSGAQKPKR